MAKIEQHQRDEFFRRIDRGESIGDAAAAAGFSLRSGGYLLKARRDEQYAQAQAEREAERLNPPPEIPEGGVVTLPDGRQTRMYFGDITALPHEDEQECGHCRGTGISMEWVGGYQGTEPSVCPRCGGLGTRVEGQSIR